MEAWVSGVSSRGVGSRAEGFKGLKGLGVRAYKGLKGLTVKGFKGLRV